MKYLAGLLLLAGVSCFYPCCAGGADFIRGDTDSSGTVEISDAIFTLQWLFTGGAEPGCLSAADADDNSSVELSDAIYTLGYLFLGGAALPAPYPECGEDPTPGRLSCQGSSACACETPINDACELTDENGDYAGSRVCLPSASGSFPGVLYSHGGKEDAVGGDIEGTCEALAAAGYLGYSKARCYELQLDPGRLDVRDGLDDLLATRCLDAERLAVMGYSRGGLLSLELALDYPDLFDAVILMAPAPGNGALEEAMADPRLGEIRARFLVLVSGNDQCQGANHVSEARELSEALDDAGLDVSFEVLADVPDRCGHYLFDTVNDYCKVSAELCYWPRVINFLDEHVR